jgi:hypothetical protein
MTKCETTSLFSKLLLLKPQILANVLRHPQAAPTPPNGNPIDWFFY